MVDSSSGPSSAPYVFDSGTGILRINGKDFKLSAPGDVLTDFGSRMVTVMGVAGAIREAIDSFSRGEWLSYANAGEKIKALNAEARMAKGDLDGLSAEFNTFFDPRGVRAEFGENAPAFTHFVKSLIRGAAHVGLTPIVETAPAAQPPAPPAAAPAPAPPVEAPVQG